MPDSLVDRAAKKNNRLNAALGGAAALGTLGLEAYGRSHGNVAPLKTILARTGLAGIGTYGMLAYLGNKMKAPAKHTEEQYNNDTFNLPYRMNSPYRMEVNKMASRNRAATEFYDGTGFNEFMKVAREELGKIASEVPRDVAYDAYLLYQDLPDYDRVSTVCGLHEIVDAGFDKIAMELIAANVLREEAQKDRVKLAKQLALESAALGKPLEKTALAPIIGKIGGKAMKGMTVAGSMNDKVNMQPKSGDNPSGFYSNTKSLLPK